MEKLMQFTVAECIPQPNDVSQDVMYANIRKHMPPDMAEETIRSIEFNNRKRDLNSMNTHLEMMAVQHPININPAKKKADTRITIEFDAKIWRSLWTSIKKKEPIRKMQSLVDCYLDHQQQSLSATNDNKTLRLTKPHDRWFYKLKPIAVCVLKCYDGEVEKFWSEKSATYKFDKFGTCSVCFSSCNMQS